jgi:hypothetical protein
LDLYAKLRVQQSVKYFRQPFIDFPDLGLIKGRGRHAQCDRYFQNFVSFAYMTIEIFAKPIAGSKDGWF